MRRTSGALLRGISTSGLPVLSNRRHQYTELPNLGKEQIFVRLKPWCEQRHQSCPGVSTIERMIAAVHDKMRLIPVRLDPRGKALLIKKRSTKPRRRKRPASDVWII
ncbi:hypothetical protein AAHP21_004637 [Salmonella enterica subsp. enterica serovar Montevideo]|nr:hypothetical protein [Salmonella enterica]